MCVSLQANEEGNIQDGDSGYAIDHHVRGVHGTRGKDQQAWPAMPQISPDLQNSQKDDIKRKQSRASGYLEDWATKKFLEQAQAGFFT